MSITSIFGSLVSQNGPANLRVILSTDHDRIIKGLKEFGAGNRPLLTNGTYAHGVQAVVPTTLAATQREIDDSPEKHSSILVFVNSNESMDLINQKLKAGSPDQSIRALSVGLALAQQYPDYQVIVGFYDEETPRELYKKLITAGIHYDIYKFGYGIPGNDDEPPKEIVGAEDAFHVSAFPLPGKLPSDRPYCFTITDDKRQANIKITDLTKVIGPHGRPYLSDEGRALIPLAKGLEIYGETWKQWRVRNLKKVGRTLGLAA